MQIVTPIDIESALAAELDARLESINAHATPAPDDIGAGAVVVQAIGGGEQTAVSDLFDVVIYAFASTYDAALATGRAICGAVRILWMDGAVAAPVTFTTSTASPPYIDPDPDRPTLCRVTVRATVGARGQD